MGGVTLALGEQEAVQVTRAGQQLDTDLVIGSSLGTFPHASVTELGDFAGQMAFMGSYPPATADLPVYDALRADMAASGEEALQTENLKSSPMRSWIGLYALLYMMREAEMTEFTGEAITAMLQEAQDVPMLDMFGGEDWTPNLDHAGAVQAGRHQPLGHLPVGRARRRRRTGSRGTGSSSRRSAGTRSCAARSSGHPPRSADRVNNGAGGRLTARPPLVAPCSPSCSSSSSASGPAPPTRCSRRAPCSSTGARAWSTSPRGRSGPSPPTSPSSTWSGDREWPVWPAVLVAVVVAGLTALVFQVVVLRALRGAAAIVRVIATIGLLGLLQAIVLKRHGASNQPVDAYLPDRVFDWGGYTVQEERLYLVGITVLLTVGLWAWTRYTRVGLAINASAQNERAVQTLGWSPDRLAALTWTIGGMLGGLAAVLAAPLTGLSATTFTIVVTVAGLGAALLGGFRSFPLTLLGGLIIGVGEAMATLYGSDVTDFLNQDLITGLNRMPAFLVIFLVVVAGGRGLPLRSHVVARLPEAGHGPDQHARGAPRVGDPGRAAVRRDGRRVGPGHLHLAGQRHHDPVDRGAHRLRGADLARPVGVRRHRGADRRPVRARRGRRSSWRSSSGSCSPSRSASSSRCRPCAPAG